MSRHPNLRPSIVALVGALVLQACTPLATLDTVVTRDRKVGAGQSIEVNIVRAGGAVDSEQEMDLEVGDNLSTGPSSFAFVRFAGGTEFVLLPSTDLVVGKGRIEVDGGAVLGKIRGAFRVDTPHGWAEVVGTEILVEIGEDSTVVTVLEGLVGVGWTGGPEQPVLLERGSVWSWPRAETVRSRRCPCRSSATSPANSTPSSVRPEAAGPGSWSPS